MRPHQSACPTHFDMTTKQLLSRSVLLFLLTLVIVPTHLSLIKDVTWLSEKLFAPAYQLPSQDEAYERGDAMYTAEVEKTQERMDDWEVCQQEKTPYFAKAICGARPVNVAPISADQLVANGRAMHRAVFEYEEIAIHNDTTENLLNFTFGSVYILIALAELRFIAKWFNFKILPRLRSTSGRLKETVPDLGGVKSVLARRRLQQLEKEFNTLKNLHENGLIDDAAFEQRKAELRASLEGRAS